MNEHLQTTVGGSLTFARHVGVLALVALGSCSTSALGSGGTSQAQEAIVGRQVLVRVDDSWFVRDRGQLYHVDPKVISVQFAVGAEPEQIDNVAREFRLRLFRSSPLGVHDYEIGPEGDLIEVLLGLRGRSDIVSVAEANSIGSFSVGQPSPDEILLQEKRFVREGDDWYLLAPERRFLVIPNSLSVKFKEGTSESDRADFLAAHDFRVVRDNRLGIHDLECASERHAVEYMTELQSHPLLEFIEVNTVGVYGTASDS